MGIALPQLAPASEDRASGASVIDGSLKFDGSYLKKTPGSVGNRKTFTWSGWVKLNELTSFYLFSVPDGVNGHASFMFDGGQLRWNTLNTSTNGLFTSNASFRDTGWYHVVFAFDATESTTTDRIKVYVNGERLTSSSYTAPDGSDTPVNNTVEHSIGARYQGVIAGDFNITNNYFIDGQALGPEEFGYTDLLTGTWRPKKYTGAFTRSSVNDGTNWTQGLSATSSNSSLSNGANAFDGDLTTRAQTTNAATGKELTWAPSSAINFTTSLEVYCDQGSNVPTATWNGNTVNPGGGAWVTVYSGSGEISSTYPLVINTQTAAQFATLKGVRIDGEILIDNLVNSGVNSFYLPMDGNSPIGEDQSGTGNDWTPVYFGGSVELDKSNISGARPILNTDGGGRVARPGVFGSDVGFHEIVSGTSGSGNPYIFTGRGTQPTLNFIRGATYSFDYSSATSHPLRFATAADAAGSTEYTDGTSISSNYITITVPHNAPDTLYYYCTNHSGMGNSISVTTDETKADPYAWKCVFASSGLGSGQDDSSSINPATAKKILTNNGPMGYSGRGNFYNQSFEYNGSTDYLSTPDHDDFNFGSGDFCIEQWARPESYPNTYGMLTTQYTTDNSSSSTFNCLHNGQYKCWFYYNSNAFTLVDSVNSTVTTNEWHHFAVTREGNVFRMFVDGKLVASDTQNVTLNDSAALLTVGADGQTNYKFKGQIQDARIYKGVAKYTQDFVIPSTDADVYTETPVGIVGKSQIDKVTDGAVRFYNTDSLTVTDSADLAFGTGDFTVEMFFYSNTVSGNDVLYDSRATTGNSADGFSIVRNGDQLRTYCAGNYQISPTHFSVSLHRWYHLAVTREGSTQRMFIDGVLVGTAAFTADLSQQKTRIGSDCNGGEEWDGYISNVRIIKGTAIYYTNGSNNLNRYFTPPTAPLTSITNTKLLCCQTIKEEQNNFIRMFRSENLYTTKSDILANAIEIGDGDYLNGEYWYIVPEGTEPIDGSNNKVFSSNPTWTTQTSLFVYNGSSWTQTVGGYNNNDYRYVQGSYTGFSYQDNDDTDSYSIYPSRDFIVAAVNGDTSPSTLIGNAPSRIPYYKFNGAVKPSTIIGNGKPRSVGLSPFNTDINTVRGQETTYPTMNPDAKNSSITLEDGNLLITSTDSHGQKKIAHSNARIPIGGKWFVEWTCEGGAGASTLGIGKGSMVDWRGSDTQIGAIGDHYSWGYEVNGNLFHNGNQGGSFPAADDSDIIGMTIDTTGENFKIQWYRNGALIRSTNSNIGDNGGEGNACEFTDIPSDDYIVMMSHHTPNYDIRVNFGQKPFKFPPPDGFQPINNSTSLPETVITRPDQYVGVTTYKGNNTVGRIIDIGRNADLVWVKKRTAENHILVDTVRGANNFLMSDATNTANTSGGPITGIGATVYNGFIVDNNGYVNASSADYVCWNWKAGGDKNTFNVDDVGYANASDVNMSVGSLNTVGYNDIKDWSNFVYGTEYPGQTKSRLFDGDMSTGLIPNSGTGSLKFKPPLTDFPSITKLRIYGYSYTGYANGITVNGNDYTSLFNTSGSYSTKSKWVTIPETHIEKIEWSIEANGTENGHLGAIEVDGKILVDLNETPPDLPSLAATGSSVGTKQGFSIVKYNGHSSGSNCTVAHGLSQKPDFMVIKCLDTAHNWTIWHKDLTQNGATPAVQPGNQYIEFTYTSTSTGNTRWNRQTPTDHVFHLGTEGSVNQGGQAHIAYLWHDVPGLQKFGMYKGVGGNADGQYVSLGFRPAIVWVKDMNNSNSNSNWCVFDNLRPGFNKSPAQNRLHLDENVAEDTDRVGNGNGIDILSNGFRVRSDNWYETNLSTGYYLYCAWADTPSINLYGGQSNAR